MISLLSILLLFGATVEAFQPHGTNAWQDKSRLSYANTFDDHTTTVAPRTSDSTPREVYFDNIFEAPSLYAIRVLLKHSRTQDTLSVFRYHAPYCQACQKVAPKFERLARQQGDVNFIQVPVSSKNPEKNTILETMQVPSIPWGQVWHPQAGLVEELSLNPKYFKDFVSILQSYQEESCPLPEDIYQACGVYGAPYYRKEREHRINALP